MHACTTGERFALRQLLWLAAAALFVAAPALGAETGYYDDFSGEMRGWADSNAYTVSQADGVLDLQVEKQTKWEGQYLHLGGAHDFSASPFVNLAVRSDTPCILHVYMVDGENNDLRERKVRVVDGFVTLSYDFSGAERVDLSAVTGMIFTVNGAANSWSGTVQFDELRVGDRAEKLAVIEVVPNEIRYRDTGPHTVRLTGLEGVAEVEVSGAEGLIRNAGVSELRGSQATLSYECIPDATGSGLVTLDAVPAPTYAANSVSFTVTVEDNLPPTIDPVEDLTVPVGEPQTVRLSGITDGNVAAEQALDISAASSSDEVIAPDGLTVTHAPGSPHAALSFLAHGAGDATVTVVLLDGQMAETTFNVTAVPEWNHAPTVAPPADRTVFNDVGEMSLPLTGIGDGDDGGQPLEVAAASSDESLVGPVRVEYDGGDTATLHAPVNPDTAGTCTIEVTVQDGGGAPDNNGDRSTSASFQVTTRVRPRTGYAMDFSDWDAVEPRWRPESAIGVSHETVADQDVMAIEMQNKVTFGGLWLEVPDLDLSEFPYLTAEVKPEDDLQFNVYFYDGNERRNSGATQTANIPAGEWTKVVFDFTGDGQMENNQGEPIRADWVTGVLFNFHPELTWPFTRYSGTLLMRNLRIGDEADVPAPVPVCTVDPVADRVHLADAGPQQVTLTGLGSGDGQRPAVSVASSAPDVVPEPEVGPVGADGTAELTYTVGEAVGESTIRVEVTAEGSEPTSTAFAVSVLSDDPADALSVKVDCTDRDQVIYGFGTFSNQLAPELYAGKLGASAMRVGLIGNQIEWLNDNSDSGVLYRGALDYGAFDFEHLRRLKEAGVETFILSSWSPPAWMKANLSLNYQQPGFQGDSDRTANRLDYYRYQEFAESMVAVYRMFQEEAGIELAAIGLQNEPAFHEPYASAILDPGHFVELIKVVGRRFKQEGIPARLYMPEQVFTQTGSMHRYIDALNADPEAEKYCDIVATHGYDAKGVGEARPTFDAWTAMWERAQEGSVPKEMWMTETYPAYEGWESAFRYGLYLYGSLEHGHIGLWTSWGIEGQLINRGRPNPAFYVCSQFWRYIRPGARRVTSTSSDPQVLATSYVNDGQHGGGVVTVLINNADEARAVRREVAGRPVGREVRLLTTDRVRRRADGGTVAADGLMPLPAKSVTTVLAE
ncbi:MAG: hypothetical protein R6V05_05935 [Candidatus Brocadiia bacterium]